MMQVWHAAGGATSGSVAKSLPMKPGETPACLWF
jgi:hypothetical protein